MFPMSETENCYFVLNSPCYVTDCKKYKNSNIWRNLFSAFVLYHCDLLFSTLVVENVLIFFFYWQISVYRAMRNLMKHA